VGWIPGRSVEPAPPRERTASAVSTEPMMVTYGSRRPAAAPAAAPAPRATAAPSAASAPTPLPEVVLHFGFDRSELTEAAKNTLATALTTLAGNAQSLSFALEGHADATGA
jgi:outer membrane protein OmpA-like peptidoglycan-associated protein